MIRNILRKWLGVHDCKEPEIVDLSGYVKKSDIEDCVIHSINESFKDDPNERYGMVFHHFKVPNARGLIDLKVRDILNGDQEKEVKTKVNKIINSETVIDDLVERINRKQLNK